LGLSPAWIFILFLPAGVWRLRETNIGLHLHYPVNSFISWNPMNVTWISCSLLPLPKTRNINEKSMEESEERRRRQQKHDLVLWVIGFIFLLLLQSCHSLVSSLGLAVTSDEK